MRRLMLAFALSCDSSNIIAQDCTSIPVTDSGQDTMIDVVQDTRQEAVPSHQEILIIGDSEAMYTEWRIKIARSQGIVQPNENITFDYYSGTTVTFWENGYFKKVISRHSKPDVLIIFLGTNNHNLSYMPDTKNILGEIISRGINCIWVGPVDVYGKEWPMNNWMKKAISPTCKYIDVHPLNIQLEDKIHPTRDGNLKWIREIWKVKNGT